MTNVVPTLSPSTPLSSPVIERLPIVITGHVDRPERSEMFANCPVLSSTTMTNTVRADDSTRSLQGLGTLGRDGHM
jgi:hypothetical protein